MHTAFGEPFEKFRVLFDEATRAQPKDPNAMTLATVGANGRPSVRVVLLKGFDEQGFTFFTNYESRKGRELLTTKVAALCFYWPSIDQQVRVEGDVEQLSAAESDEYFKTRPRVSQLGAWASRQSEVLDKRETLEKQLAAFTRRFEGLEVQRPPHWGGFRLVPSAIEFWKQGEFRLHHRTRYTRAADGWEAELLNP